uniref:Taste receptor type 2 n=1 Tax=Podarcis muralis TaxID=64176 RepID=A0A670K9G2_PODMU
VRCVCCCACTYGSHYIRWKKSSYYLLRNMPTSYELFGFILLVIETLIGMVGNGFIAIVNFIDWHRSRKLSPADMILSCLGLFRFLFHEVVIQSAIFNLFFMDAVRPTDVKMAGYSSWTFVTTTDLWFATWLSVLYCVKIANFSHPLFLQMKRRFPGLVPWLLLGTVGFSAITTTVAVIGSSKMTKCNLFESFSSNNSDSELKCLTTVDTKTFYKAVLRDASTEVHLNAIKALASFSILYISSFIMEILTILNYWIGITDVWEVCTGNLLLGMPFSAFYSVCLVIFIMSKFNADCFVKWGSFPVLCFDFRHRY